MRRGRLLVAVPVMLLTSGCGFSACGMTQIPGGFPPAQRHANAVQYRLSSTGVDVLETQPARLLSALGPMTDGVVDLDMPPSCASSTQLCCPGGTPQTPCGPLALDVKLQGGDSARLTITPVAGQSRVDVLLFMRAITGSPLPVNIPTVGQCAMQVDSTAGTNEDLRLDATVNLVQDLTAGTTRVEIGSVTLSQLETTDITLLGGAGCQIANPGLGFFTSTLQDSLAASIQDLVVSETCKSCELGGIADCGPFADACTDGVCMIGSACLQELGLTGRAPPATPFPAIVPGAGGSVDVYGIAGGYATTNLLGIAFGALGGVLASGAAGDRCGPSVAAPAWGAMASSTYFQGNTRPDNAQAFELALGVHRSEIEQLAFAAYDGGSLCLTASGAGVGALASDALFVVAPSAVRLVRPGVPLTIGWRPQSPPSVTLGTNVFTGGALDIPLLDVTFAGMEIDVFVPIDEQEVRVLTAVADVHLPIGLRAIAPGVLDVVMPAADDAFTGVSVTNSGVLAETPAALALLLDDILAAARDQLAAGVAPVVLPTFLGFELDATSVTAVDSLTYVGIFGDLHAP